MLLSFPGSPRECSNLVTEVQSRGQHAHAEIEALGQRIADAGIQHHAAAALLPSHAVEPGQQLQSLEANVAMDNVFDANKVEAIKLAISNGEFSIDAGKIADGLIDTVQSLLTQKK